MELAGTVAVVTGGGRGIGAAVAAGLAGAGADVVLTYRFDGSAADAVVRSIEAKGGRAAARRVDSADPSALEDAVDSTVERFGRLDVLVSNAGDFVVGQLEELDPATSDRVVATNVRGPFVAARAAGRHLGAGGRIITIGTNVIGRTPLPGFALYSLSKTALVGLTKGLARDLGPRGITANLVNPGPTETASNPADGPTADTVSGLTALGRYARPEEIADAVAYLAGPRAGYLTGAVADVDGGFTV